MHDVGTDLAAAYAKLPPPSSFEKRKDLPQLAQRYSKAVDGINLINHAANLGVTTVSLREMGVGWDGYAWTFPMQDANGKVIGIMRRYEDGRKMSVKGGTLGLFVPSCVAPALRQQTLIVCEGATDTAAMLSMGWKNVIGRPNCGSGSKLLTEFINTHICMRVMLVSDNDDAGVQGARDLADFLMQGGVPSKIITPPAGIKDARAWLKAGGDMKAVRLMAFVSPEYRREK